MLVDITHLKRLTIGLPASETKQPEFVQKPTEALLKKKNQDSKRRVKIKELQGLKHTSVEVGVYLQEHVVEDEKQIYDLGSHNKDVKTTGRLVEPNTLQLADELECSCKISMNGCVSILLRSSV